MLYNEASRVSAREGDELLETVLHSLGDVASYEPERVPPLLHLLVEALHLQMGTVNQVGL